MVEVRRKSDMDKKMTANDKEYRIVKLLGKGKGDYYQFGNKIEAETRDYERLKRLVCLQYHTEELWK